MSETAEHFGAIHEAVRVLNQNATELLQAHHTRTEEQRRAMFEVLEEMADFEKLTLATAEKLFEEKVR